MKKVPDHLRYLDPTVEMVDKMTPQERCNAAGYHVVVGGACACGYVYFEPSARGQTSFACFLDDCQDFARKEITTGKRDKNE